MKDIKDDDVLIDDGDVNDVQMMNDADVLGKEHPEMEELLKRPFTFMTGTLYEQGDRRNTKDGDWQGSQMPLLAWLEGKAAGKNTWGLTRHPVGKTKGGVAFVPGVAIGGKRTETAMQTMFAVVVDIDGGAKLADVIKTLVAKDVFALVYTSWRHGLEEIDLKHDDIVRKLGLSEPPTVVDVKRYVREGHFKGGWFPEDVIDQFELIDARRETKDGMRTVISVPPLDKFRVVIPLAEPVELADLGLTLDRRKEAWADAVCGVAVNLLEADFDTASCNANQMFYTPRHPAGADNWHSTVVMGRPLRFSDIEPHSKADYLRNRGGVSDPFAAGTVDNGPTDRETFFTSSGMNLNLWHKKYKERWQAADVIESFCPDKIVGGAGDKPGTATIECPFEHMHSTSGGVGTIVMNPDVCESGYWTITCQHDACNGRDKLEFIREMVDQNWFDESLLTDDEWLLPLADQDMEDEPVTLTADAVQQLIEVANITPDTSEADLKKFLSAHLDCDLTTRASLVDALSTSRGSPGATKLTPSQVEKIWKDLTTERTKKRLAEEAKTRADAPTPDYVSREKSTAKSVSEAAAAAKWLPSGFTHRNDWFGTVKDDKFCPVCRPFEVVYMADGAKGSTRTNQVTIRYQHRAKNIGIVESTFRIGDTYKDSGTILGTLRNEGLDFHPNAKTEDILTLLRAISSDREAIYTSRSGWITPERDVFVSPTGEVVKKDGDRKLYVLDQTVAVSDKKSGTLELAVEAASAALLGRNAKRFLPGFMLGAVGCLADFLNEDMSVIVANEGKAKHGKSTSLKSGVSWFTVPTPDGLLVSGRMSPTAMERMAVKATGAAFAPDEQGSSKLSAAEEQEMFMLFAESKGAGRGTPDGGMRDYATWKGAMGVSTERGLIARIEAEGGDVRAGAVSRVLTVNFDSAPKLDAVVDAEELAAYQVLAHGGAYGWLGPAFARHLMEWGVERTSARVSELAAELGAGHSGAAERVVRTVALFRVAVEVAQDAGLLPDDDEAGLAEMLNTLLDETIAQRAIHLDTDRQPLNLLRLKILEAVAAGQIVEVGAETQNVRGQLIGYYKGNSAVDDASLSEREYILPERLYRYLGVPVDLDALIADLRSDDAIIEPGEKTKHAKRGLFEGTPGEGKKEPSLRIKGEWVHG